MLRRLLVDIFFVFALSALAAPLSYAQADGAYSPYSIFAIGDVGRQGTAYNRTMGGVGIASRNNRYVNIMNPAAVTARDSLSFMADYTMYGDNKVFSQGGIKSVNNTFNINDVVLSFPILSKNMAMMVGISPFSDTGFEFSYKYTDPDVIGSIGNISNTSTGSGSIYKSFAAVGYTFLKRISVGAELDYYFGNITKNFTTTISDASYNGIKNTIAIQTNAVGGKFGIQYEQPLGDKVVLGVGATYSTGARMKGYYTDASYSSGSVAVDTLYYRSDTLSVTKKARIASELGVGITLKRPDKWMVELDYTRSDWSNSGMENISGFSAASSPFSTTVAEAYRIGMEFVPNRNDIRYYFNQVAYRAGAYYKNEYYKLYGKNISSMGITIGATFPVFRWYNGITVGLELGQRGSLSDNMIREKYINFSIGVNIFDIWFRKTQYE